MRAVETNVLVRVLTRDDLRQTQAADTFIEPGAWVSTLVLVETLWVLSSVFNRVAAELAQAVEIVLAHKSLVIQDSDLVGAALESFRSRPSVSFADYLILELARSAGYLPLGTFDRALAKMPGTHRLA